MVKAMWNVSDWWDDTENVPFGYDSIGNSDPKVTNRDERLHPKYYALFGAENMNTNGTYALQWLIDVTDPEAPEKIWDFMQQYGRTQIKTVSVAFTLHVVGTVTWWYYRKPVNHAVTVSSGYRGGNA